MERKHHQETHGTSVKSEYVPMPGPDHPGGPGWVVFLCNQEGFWTYDRWITRNTDILRVIDDVLHGIDTGIIEIDNGPVITLVEVR